MDGISQNVRKIVRLSYTEKRNQNIRDDILEMNGLNPSWSRQGSGGTVSTVYEE